MKLVKYIMLTLTAVFLTGCYTQLKHTTKSQTDKGPRYEEEGYIPVGYKDYEYAERYDACDCNPYRSYSSVYFSPSWNYHSFYDSYWGRPHYQPYFSSHYWALSPYARWRMRVGFGYHHSFYNSFGFSLSWGSPFYHSFYGNSFYYDPYWYGYHRPFTYNYYNFYGSGYYRNVYRDDRDRTYRRRSIGTSRVSSDRNRSRSRSTGDRSRVRSRGSDPSNASSTVRRRSTGSSRTGDGSVGRSRSRSNNNSGSGSVGRSRSRGSSGSSSSGGRSRSRGDNNLRSSINVRSSGETDASVVRRRSGSGISDQLRRQLRSVDNNRPANRARSRSGFLNRLKKVFDTGNLNISNNNSRSPREIKVRSRSGSRTRSTIDRSNSRSRSRSTVRQSRSSSSGKSRSRGSSSRSRSRGN